MKKYKVTLTAEERAQLQELIAQGKAAAKKLAHARASIMRFVRGSQSLRLDMADRLAACFGLELRPKRKGR